MIVDNQSNLKVHFAGLENQDFAQVLHECGGINYSLFTVFPFIANEVGIKPMKMKTCTIESPIYLQNSSRHTIMDSGLFTLMFGAHAGKRDYKFIDRWYNLIIQFVLQNQYNKTVVEVDCQKILGVEKAWEFRERMKIDLPNNRQINVFHKEDGQKGLDRLIEFSDYIAISVPELRALGQKNYTSKLAHYIKNKKPSIDIHLLGCTENKLLKELNFCSTSDSTSWQQVNRFGVLKYNDGVKTMSARNSNISIDNLMDRYKERLVKILSKWMEVTPKRLDYYSKYAIAGELLKMQYTTYAGNQD
jgi:hypothetical protein